VIPPSAVAEARAIFAAFCASIQHRRHRTHRAPLDITSKPTDQRMIDGSVQEH
jgi:hypothetical protein